MPHDAFDLDDVARRAMLENGFAADFEPLALREVGAMSATLPDAQLAGIADLRALDWSSIDNDESRDLDQIEVLEKLDGGHVRLKVAVADVDSRVPAGSAVDAHAMQNTTSVYTGAKVFSMIPERLSTDLTSLDENQDRLAIVIDMVIDSTGAVIEGNVYRALVRNHAQLAYNSVSAWLEGNGPSPARIAQNAAIAQQVREQHAVAEKLKALRHERGALDLETIEARPVTRDGRVVDLEVTRKGPAREMVEDFMIAANTTMGRFLERLGVSSIRRIVKSPERWQRIVSLAAGLGETLPTAPDSRALAAFLSRMRQRDPDHFADLSLSVVKLMGPGEYALDPAGSAEPAVHFGLGVQDYTHSTAPNRRYADLVTQRLLKASLAGAPPPYSDADLIAIAERCTQKENDARKVERRVRKSAAAMLLADRIGNTFDAIVTGANAKGTFVRLLAPPAEGRVVRGEQVMDVGDKVRVRLLATQPEKGFIDFARA
jgi:exoribonuclease-2